MKKLSIEQFIEKATTIHGNAYDYSKSVYVRWDVPVEIICYTHGSFTQTPNSHLSGRKCINCVRRASPILFKRKTTEQFIVDARRVHGNTYNYELVDYSNAHGYVEIVCPKHGIFKKSGTHHLAGQGCPICKDSSVKLDSKNRTKVKQVRKKKLRKKTTEQFIIEAAAVHNDKYDYTNTIYEGTHKPVYIICKMHGEIKTTPKRHLGGSGCKHCFNDSRTKTLEIFKKESNITHNNKYDYSEFNYINSKIKGTVICNIHGRFMQTPNQHLYYGCRKCNSIGGYCESWFINETRKRRNAKIYLIQFADDINVFYKIGITTRPRRFYNRYVNYKVIKMFDRDMDLYTAFKLEQHILMLVLPFSYVPVDFKLRSGRTECFKCDTSKLNEILDILKE